LKSTQNSKHSEKKNYKKNSMPSVLAGVAPVQHRTFEGVKFSKKFFFHILLIYDEKYQKNKFLPIFDRNHKSSYIFG